MKVVVQRVARAAVAVEGLEVARIAAGLVALVGVAVADGPRDAEWIGDKVAALRVFPDDAGAMQRSVAAAGGAVLVVSQFTLLGDVRKGRRPSFYAAARPEAAEPLVRAVADRIRAAGIAVSEGVFGAAMALDLVNDGPVTILLDSRRAP